MEFKDVSEWLTVEEVARRLGLSPDRIRRLIREKVIRASKLGKWLVRPEDLAEFVHSRMNVPDDREV